MSEPGPAAKQSGVIDAILADLTLEEKAAQVGCAFYPGQKVAIRPGGWGGVAWPETTEHHPPRAGAANRNQLQRDVMASSRHGLPAIVNEEALCGLKVAYATVMPDALGQAATWDPELVEAMGAVIGRHMAAVGVHQALAPLCDVARDPRWGRIEETYGEDPYLVGCTAAAYVRGLQGAAGGGQMATLKHFIAYSASDGGRNLHPTPVGPREMREVHGLGFEIAIRHGGARGVMASYNAVDGSPVQSDAALLTALLRDEYRFEGVVISDLGSVEQLQSHHGTTASRVESIARSLEAGLDLELAGPPATRAVVEAVRSGLLSEESLERAVRTVLRLKEELGLLDDPFVDEAACPEVLDSADDRAVARRVAERSIVLLRNDLVVDAPLLPIAATVRSIAVIGPNADRPLGLLGNYSFPVLDSAVMRMLDIMDPSKRGHGGVPPETQRGHGGVPPETQRGHGGVPLETQRGHGGVPLETQRGDEPIPSALADSFAPKGTYADDIRQTVETVPVVSVLEGIRSRVGDDVSVTYARGCGVEDPHTSDIAEAASVAAAAEVAIVVVGDQSGIGRGATVGEGVDSASVELPGPQRALVEAVVATGTPTVVVLTHGRPFVLGWMVELVPAILTAWFPGEEGGNAVAAALFGDVNPGGKVPVSFLPHGGIAPLPYNRTELGGTTYGDVDLTPVFAFGHGLSYTSFAYAPLRLSAEEVGTDGSVDVTCRITNTGPVDGDEVVQLYLRDPVARTTRPRLELKGFQRVTLAAGGSVDVTFHLSAHRAALWCPTDGWIVEPGDLHVMVGAGSEDIRQRTTVRLTGPVNRVGTGRELLTPVTLT